MRTITAIFILCSFLLCGCFGARTAPVSNIDIDWTKVYQEAENAVEAAEHAYALWELLHETLGTPEDEIAEKREAFKASIERARDYLGYVRTMIPE